MIVKAAIASLVTDSDAQLIVNTQSVISGVTGNERFTPAPAQLALVVTALDEFMTARSNAADGGRELTAIKNAKRAILVSLLRQLASYVTETSNGDLATLLSSGFRIQKPTRAKVGPLAAPTAPTVKHGVLSGDIEASGSPVTGTSVYNTRIAKLSAPDVYVQTAQTPGRRVTFSGLTPGETYAIDQNAVGAAGPSDWSDVATLMSL